MRKEFITQIEIVLDNKDLQVPINSDDPVEMFWFRKDFFVIEMKSETRGYAIFRVKDGSKIGEINDVSFVTDGFGYLTSPTRNGIFMVDKNLKAYKASIQALMCFGKLDFLLTEQDDNEKDWK